MSLYSCSLTLDPETELLEAAMWHKAVSADLILVDKQVWGQMQVTCCKKGVNQTFQALSHRESASMQNFLDFILLFLEELVGMSWTNREPMNYETEKTGKKINEVMTPRTKY